jgi:hypothetical protein
MWHSRASGLSSVSEREEVAAYLTWGPGDVASGREVERWEEEWWRWWWLKESSDVSRLGRVSRFGQGRTAGPPGWDMITLCSLKGNSSVAQLARVLVLVPRALGSILVCCNFFSLLLIRTL